MSELESTNILYTQVSELLNQARKSVLQSVNTTITKTYYEIGKLIVEEEQNGNVRAEYGKKLIGNLSNKLSQEFGKGFSQRNLEQMRQFYLTYSKSQTLSAELKLSWYHYLKLMIVDY